jgi:hypothetical protein
VKIEVPIALVSIIGKEITLPPESEEVASFFGSMLETDHAKNPQFTENFFRDFQSILAEYPPVSLSFSPLAARFLFLIQVVFL